METIRTREQSSIRGADIFCRAEQLKKLLKARFGIIVTREMDPSCPRLWDQACCSHRVLFAVVCLLCCAPLLGQDCQYAITWWIQTTSKPDKSIVVPNVMRRKNSIKLKFGIDMIK